MCDIPLGWNEQEFNLYLQVNETFYIAPCIALTLPSMISLLRYTKVIGQQPKLIVILIGFTALITITQVVSSLVFISATWFDLSHLYDMAALVHKTSLAANLLLLVTTNCLLLRHVRTNSMAATDRTHNNEQRLTLTILIVNGCLVCTWLPDCILGLYSTLLQAGIVQSSYFLVIVDVRMYVYYITFINGALNGLIYTLRLARIKSFYRTALRNIFTRDNAAPEGLEVKRV